MSEEKNMILRKKPRPISIPPKNKILQTEEDIKLKYLSKEAGTQIAQARTTKKMTQSQLAQRLNISVYTINNYEKGNIVPDRRILNMLNDFFQIRINY